MDDHRSTMRSIDNGSFEGSEVPIGVNTNARRSERAKRVQHSFATDPGAQRIRLLEAYLFCLMSPKII